MKIIFTLPALLFTIIINANGYTDSFPQGRPVAENMFGRQPTSSGPATITLRCRSTTFSTDPLLVIDGVPYEPKQIQALNPNDIEAVFILKDASATALYGCRGTNGVIIITTKAALIKKFIIRDFLTGKIIPGASIFFSSESDSIKAATNDSGILITDKLKPGVSYKVNISSTGYKTFSAAVTGKEQEILLERDVKECSNVIISTTYCPRTISCGFSLTKITACKKMNSLDEMPVHPLYPNPLRPGNVFNLELEGSKDGAIQVAIFSMNGSLVSLQSGKIVKGFNRISMTADTKWAAGIYNIQLRNENGTLIRQEKLVVQ